MLKQKLTNKRKTIPKQVKKQKIINKTEPSVSKKNEKFQIRITNYDFNIISTIAKNGLLCF